MHRVLIVDDEPQMRRALQEVLKRKGYDTAVAGSGEEALTLLAKEAFDVVVTDVKMSGMDGLALLRSIRRSSPTIPVLMMTAFGTIEDAIEAMREGARDYILKPFSPETLLNAISKVVAPVERESGIITRNRRMEEIIKLAKEVASTDATVLIMGESGTGKELLARFIHRVSRRKGRPFIAINCASIPEGLLESELFGYEKGAFTGAVSRRVGKFEMANGGTLLLDEIGEMGLALQAKLLRVIQEREIDRLGGRGPVSLDIRIIATTNRDLKKEVLAGRFREDLFYRLNVFPITLPPLRERPEDIPILAEHFLKTFTVRNRRSVEGFTEEAMRALTSHPWKGNVRELENVIERAVLVCRGRMIGVEDLFYGEAEPAPPFKGGTIREMERELISRTLKETGGNKTMAAKRLGISIRTLRNKLKEYAQKEEILAP